MQNELSNDTFLNKLFYGCIFLLAFSLYVSKSGLSVFFTLTILLSLFFIHTSDYKKAPALLMIVSVLIPFHLANLFSVGGPNAIFAGIKGWSSALVVLPVYVVYTHPKTHKFLKAGLLLGLFIAALRCFYLAYAHRQMLITSPESFRIGSFWDLGRWGTFTSLFCIIIYPLILASQKKSERFFYVVFFLLSFISLVLSNTRGPLVLTLGCLFLISLFFLKKIKYLFLFFIGFVILLSATPSLRHRIESVFNVQSEKTTGEIVSHNKSNLGRLNMWHVAMDVYKDPHFKPAGFENYNEILTQFLATKDTSYIDQYTKIEFSFNEPHSSYLYLLVHQGLLFSLYFWGIVFFYYFKNIHKLWTLKTNEKPLLLGVYGVLTFHLFLGVVYSQLISFEAITFFAALIMADLIGKNLSPNRTGP